MTEQVAIVTGGAKGIGKAIADRLAQDGMRIVIADLQGAEEAAATYPGGVGLTVDVASELDVERMAAEVEERCGRIDVLVNNAGLYASLEMRSFSEIPVEEWRRVMDVNVLSMFLTCRAVVPRMKGSGAGGSSTSRRGRRSAASRSSCTTSRARARSSPSPARWPRSSAARCGSTASHPASR